MADFVPTPRAKNALDNRKLNLNAPCPSAPGKFASLIWGIHANNPRLTVFTNDPADTKDYGKITANLDLPVFYSFLAKLDEVIKFNGEVKYKIENKNFIFPGGKRSEKPVVVSELWFGKDKDGVVWLSVTARDRPKIKFTFTHSDFHNFQHGDGTPFTTGETSVMVAEGYINILENMVADLAAANFIEPPKKDFNKGGNGGGNNSGGGSRTYSEPDEDLPF